MLSPSYCTRSKLSDRQLRWCRLADAYRKKETFNLYKVDYRSFCDEVDKGTAAAHMEASCIHALKGSNAHFSVETT